jgi:hypothetical protein
MSLMQRLLTTNDLLELIERPLHVLGLHRQQLVIAIPAILVLLVGTLAIYRRRPKA